MKAFEFYIKSLTPFAYKLNVKQQTGPSKHLVDHTIFDLHANYIKKKLIGVNIQISLWQKGETCP